MATKIQIDYRNPSSLVQNGLVYSEIQADPLIVNAGWQITSGFSNANGSVKAKLVDKDDNVFKLLIGNARLSTSMNLFADNENSVVSVFRPNGASIKIDSDLFNGGKLVFDVSGQTQGGLFRIFMRPIGLNTRYFGVFSGQGTGSVEFDLQVS